MFRTACTSQERAKSLLSNDKLSDVKFVVPLSLHGGTTDMSKMVIPAHRFLLAIAGPVFYVMFCGILAERNDYIDHLDCDYQWMMEFLRYIYTKEVSFNFAVTLFGREIHDSLADQPLHFILARASGFK